eukprot:m.43115 g.43115  ORF g.43115 m.43115 type:complete len:272 (+) comp7091_c0_seq2:235-1050(+)
MLFMIAMNDSCDGADSVHVDGLMRKKAKYVQSVDGVDSVDDLDVLSKDGIIDAKLHSNISHHNENTKYQKIRSFPHVDGQWPSHVFIDVSNAFMEEMEDEMEDVGELLKSFLKRPVEIISNPHASVSKSFVLQYCEIDTFVSSLKRNLLGISRFQLEMDGGGAYVFQNEDKTRHFLSIKFTHVPLPLHNIVNAVDRTMKSFSKPEFYKERDFHISLFSWSGLVKDSSGEPLLSPENLGSISAALKDISGTIACVDEISFKCGDKNFSIALS